MFHIRSPRFHWIDDKPDDGRDLCLHAEATAEIGERVLFFEQANVSSTALYLLKTLTEDHLIDTGNQMLPCCGHMWVPSEQDPESVEIIGCNCGIDWSVEHEDDTVRLTLEDGYTVTLSLSDYAAEVCAYADAVDRAYHAAPPRVVGTDPFDQEMFALYWQEFHRRRAMFS